MVMKTVKSRYVLTKNGCFKSIIVRNYKVSNALLLDDNDGKFIKNIRLYNARGTMTETCCCHCASVFCFSAQYTLKRIA